jgi:hypothetical protein
MGTVELTGLEMMLRVASGQWVPQAWISPCAGGTTAVNVLVSAVPEIEAQNVPVPRKAACVHNAHAVRVISSSL